MADGDVYEELSLEFGDEDDAKDVSETDVKDGDEKPEESESKKQTVSDRINNARKKDRETIDELKRKIESYEKLEEATKKYGIEGKTAEERADRLNAEAEGISVEEYREQRSAEEKRLKALIDKDPRVVEAARIKKEAEAEKRMREDLASIKSEFPEETAESIMEIAKTLGEEFTGRIKKGYSAADAYRLATAEIKPQKKVSTGATVSSGTAGRSFFTSEEVDRMTQDQIAKNYDKIRESMAKW